MNKSKEKTVVSVIVITYGQEKYIKQALDSITMQKTNFKFEIIVGNDCSPDNTIEVLKNYKSSGNYVMNIINREENIGATKNLYLCIKEAKGKYIAFLEGDDYWTDEYKLQKQFDFLENEENKKYVGVAADFNDVDLEGNFLIRHSDNLGRHNHKCNFKKIQNGYLDFHINSLMCRNIFFSKIEDFSIIYKIDRLVADRAIPLLLMDFGDIYILKDIVGCYRTCPNRYNKTPAECSIYMLSMYKKYEKYKFKNHKVDFSYYKARLIVDALMMSKVSHIKMKKEEKEQLFKDFNIKIFLRCMQYMLHIVIIAPGRIIKNKKLEKQRSIYNRKMESKKKNILVFPCGSEIGLEIYNSVKYSTYFNLIGASSVEDHGKYVYEDYIGGLPFITDNKVFEELKKIIKERKIDAIYPTMDLAITVLKEHEEELGCKVISSPIDTVRICLSKEKTYNVLKDVVRIPKVYKSINEVEDYPVFIKPKIGYGAIGTKLVHNKEELESYLKNSDKDNLILEYLPGEEYTIDCFTDKNGKLIYASARGRNRIKSGISVNTSFAKNQEEFVEFVKKINEKIEFRGAWFTQVKRNAKGEISLLEIASRFGGSSSLCRAIGINFPQMSLFDAFDYNVDTLKNNYNVVMDRALDNIFKCNIKYNTIYVDYDDCLVLNGNKVNIELISFLYKCINENKKIILLSKHKGNLKRELKKYKINNIFDEIIHISQNEEKIDYIKETEAIFIDDSFAERKKIKEKFNMSVFSPDMICTLL